MAVQMEACPGPAAASPSGGSTGSASRAMSSTGTSTRSSSAFRCPASTIVTGRHAPVNEPEPEPAPGEESDPGSPSALRPTQKPRHLVERPLRGREPDALQPPAGQRLEPLQRQCQVGAALGRDQRVDFVDDHRLDATGAARGRSRSGAGRATPGVVMRMSAGSRAKPGALPGGRVAGPDRDAREAVPVAASGGDRCDARQRRAQVPLDVDRQRLERRDVYDPQALAGRRLGREHEPVDAGRGTRPASCRCRWARAGAWSRRAGWRARPLPAPGSALRTPSRTTRAPRGGRAAPVGGHVGPCLTSSNGYP